MTPDARSGDAGLADAAADEVTVVVAGPLQAQISEANLVVQRGGKTLLVLPMEAFQVGVVDEINPNFNYDPYNVIADTGLGQAAQPPGLRWLKAQAATVLEDADGVTVQLELEPGLASLRIEALADDQLRVRFTIESSPGAAAFLRVQAHADPFEGFYGLGEYFDTVNHRGHTRAMQFALDLGIESGYNEAHVPVPLLIGTTGWGLFAASTRMGVFSVADGSDTLIDLAFAERESLELFIFGADQPLDITKHYYEITGYPGQIAPWALGPWVWRDENDDQAQVESDVRLIRELDLATVGYWIDRPYASGVNSFDFHPGMFPDPQGMIDTMHDAGLRVALWHTPYVGESQEATAALNAVAVEQGYYPPVHGAVANNWGRMVDLTNPDAYDWWQGLIRRYTVMGVEGFKLDYAEDVVPGIGGARNRWLFSDDTDDTTRHATFKTLYHQVYAETLPETGGFLLCRAGTWGGQTNGVIIWPGDLDANMAYHGEEWTQNGRTYKAVGGLPASLIAGLGLGPSGYPFYGADTGGYRHSPVDKETFIRWFEQTALSSVMQIGTSANDVAWELGGANGFDAETLDLYRIYTRLHLRLWPYMWTHVRRIPETGRPIQRPYGLQRPDLGRHPSDVYFVGEDLLVAPVLRPGETEKLVPFPPGDWLDWWTGTRIVGGEDLTVPAPLGTLPLYLREGGIVPLLRPTIDTLSPVPEGSEIDSYVTTPGRLFARFAAGQAGSFTLFDGTELAMAPAAEGWRFSVVPGEVFTLGAQFEVMGLGERPSAVGQLDALQSLDDLAEAGSGWVWERGVLHIRLAPGEAAVITQP